METSCGEGLETFDALGGGSFYLDGRAPAWIRHTLCYYEDRHRSPSPKDGITKPKEKLHWLVAGRLTVPNVESRCNQLTKTRTSSSQGFRQTSSLSFSSQRSAARITLNSMGQSPQKSPQ
jgi:hypothetical protein